MIYNFFADSFRERFSSVDKILICIVGTIFLIGLTTLYSVSNGNMRPWVLKQLTCFLFSLGICSLVAIVDINFWFRNVYKMYTICLLLLIAVEIFGHKSMGAARWLNLGFIKVQPSEFMKICLILSLARYFFQADLADITKNSTLIIPLGFTLIPVILVLRQPNLGTALILSIITISILFFIGVQVWKFFLCFVIVLCIIPLVWKFGLHDYQRRRVMTFLDPDSDPLNYGYNILQSKIAIGSGGTWGKGFANGTQGRLEFLPEKHTDFIFTVFCVEDGFTGSVTVVLLYSFLFFLLFYMITKCNNTFGKIIVSGVLTNFFCHFFINIAMITGILPVVGTPLFLFSYGGSITMSSLLSIGFVLNAHIHRNREISILV